VTVPDNPGAAANLPRNVSVTAAMASKLLIAPLTQASIQIFAQSQSRRRRMSGWGWLRRALFADLDPSNAYLHGRLVAFGGTIRSAAGIPTGLQGRLAYWL